MSLNQTPTGDRIHIGIFGRRNAGKSSLINAITNQNIAIVSEIKGTTTDPVQKAMELAPLGPVVFIDTPGLDDDQELGSLRIQRAVEVLNKTDIALLVVDATCGLSDEDMEILEKIQKRQIPCILIFNKIDLFTNTGERTSFRERCNKGEESWIEVSAEDDKIISIKWVDDSEDKAINSDRVNVITLMVSTVTGENIKELKDLIGNIVPTKSVSTPLVGDLIEPSDGVVLVIPIDDGAPKGRLILPQQQVIRDILEREANAIVVKETQLEEMFQTLRKPPALVITDSQIFEHVSKVVPSEILLTSFSILFARYKGVLEVAIKGAFALKELKKGDKVLISEGCTHHRQCNDIGTAKLPKWIQDYTDHQLDFEFTSGKEFPHDLTKYSCIVHCGGCMLSEREVRWRMELAKEQEIPFTNYGISIAQMNGILERSIQSFDLKK